MKTVGIEPSDLDSMIRKALDELVTVRRVNGVPFVSLPFCYPDGSFVTIRIDPAVGGYRVSDAGFAYHEATEMGFSKSAFSRTANRLGEDADFEIDNRIVFAVSEPGGLSAAISDVAEGSWRIASIFGSRFEENDDEEEIAEALSRRLASIFGEEKVEVDPIMLGASTTDWKMSAKVQSGDRLTVFQAVSPNPNSINRASTAFRDISNRDNPPQLVAVVEDFAALGKRKPLLAPARLLLAQDSDDKFRKVAA